MLVLTWRVYAKKGARLSSDALSESLLAWMSDQRDEDLSIASLTLAEIRRGILAKPGGKRRDQFEMWLSGSEGPQALFLGRIFAFDENSSLIWARLMVQGKAKGHPKNALDTIIAAVAEANNCIVVTDSEKDFAGAEIFSPLRAGA